MAQRIERPQNTTSKPLSLGTNRKPVLEARSASSIKVAATIQRVGGPRDEMAECTPVLVGCDMPCAR